MSVSSLPPLPSIFRIGKRGTRLRIISIGQVLRSLVPRLPGWYSNRSRGERRKETGLQADIQDSTPVPEEIEVLDVSTYKSRRIPPKTWRECIKKVWEVDPLECPKCHAEMKIISFITEKDVIRLILEHLNLWPKKLANASRDPPEFNPDQIVRETTYGEPFDDGWSDPGDELFMDEVYPD